MTDRHRIIERRTAAVMVADGTLSWPVAIRQVRSHRRRQWRPRINFPHLYRIEWMAELDRRFGRLGDDEDDDEE